MSAAAGAAGGLAGALTTGIAISVPATVTMPWYGYIVLGVVNVVLSFGVVYLASRLGSSSS